jgi:hypothetical protein
MSVIANVCNKLECLSVQPCLTIVRRPFKMRTTFSKCVYSMMTLNRMIHLLYGTEMSGERAIQREGEKEREKMGKSERWSVAEKGLRHGS